MKFEFLIFSMHAVRGLGSLKRQESPWVAMRCVMISRSLVKRTVPKCNPARRACYDMLCQNFSAERFAAFVDVTMLGIINGWMGKALRLRLLHQLQQGQLQPDRLMI